jgi:hypothetical protein
MADASLAPAPARAEVRFRTTLSWFAALVAVVLPVLWFTQVRPALAAPMRVASAAGPADVPAFLPGDCYLYRIAIVSLLADRDLDIRNNADWSMVHAPGNVAVANDGAWVPKHPLLLAFLALPFFALGGDRGLLVFNLVQVLLLDGLVLWLALRVTTGPIAFATAILFALGTLLRPLAFNFSPDVLSSILVVAAILTVLQRRAGLAGALLGLSIAAKWTNALFFVPAGVAVLAMSGWRGAARLALASAPWVVALAALNVKWFGSPLVTPYDRVLALASGATPLEGLAAFNVPFWIGLWSQLTDRRVGLIVSGPPILVAVPGFLFLWRRRRFEAALLLSCAGGQIALFAPYRYWAASGSGHRFLLTAIVLCAPAAAVELARFAPRRSEARRSIGARAAAASAPLDDGVGGG